MIYLAAFAVVKGGMFTYRKIMEEFQKEAQPKKRDDPVSLDSQFPKRDNVIPRSDYRDPNKRF